ncbi:hypothetical protein [Neoaquamicrobium sediminum]|uniref:hypothetical protein n=1 Tax=Neoaquamicrobium sediminum TaxID=1849104 RepID=UPI0015636310|nr:hypothetical protein [Mesorhizobium sediminum]NRC55174.1 hypothetical protein [Mesorhizobium sediminum]
MTLQTDAGQIVVNKSRGLDQSAEHLSLCKKHGWGRTTDDAIRDAKDRMRVVVHGLTGTASQHGVLSDQIGKARATAISLRENLFSVGQTAKHDLDNAGAGDAAIAALGAFIANMDAALVALRHVPSLTYETYRDAP